MNIAISENQYHPIPRPVSPLVQQLIDLMLNIKPEERPEAINLLLIQELQPYIEKLFATINEIDKEMGLFVVKYHNESQLYIDVLVRNIPFNSPKNT